VGQWDIELLELGDLAYQRDAEDRRERYGSGFGLERVADWLSGAAVDAAGTAAASPLSLRQISPRAEKEEEESPSVTYAQGGRSVRVRVPQGHGCFGARGRRRPCFEFTQKSRAALLHLMNSIDERKCPAGDWRFVTLTYPRAFPDAAASKVDLDKVVKRFEREWGRRGIIWKLEPQRRGAPHFHLAVLMGQQDHLQDEIEWWAHAWHELVGGGDRHHLRWHLGQLTGQKGPCVEVVHDWNGMRGYAGKYLGKLPEFGTGWHEPGRFWGVRGRQMLPRTIKREEMSVEVAKLVRRQVVRWIEHQPTGFYRVDQFGQVERVKLRVKEAAALAACGVSVRPYHRRWRWSKGGCSAFMPAETIERIIAWAKREIETWVPF
jgi:hypothetical protein